MTLSTIPCERCGRPYAYPEAECRRIHERHGPPFVPGVCLRCMMNDPLLRVQYDAWARQLWADVGRSIRKRVAESLEEIDRLVARFQ